MSRNADALALLEAAVPSTSNDELLGLALAVYEEGVGRALNYADTLGERDVASGTRRDTVNEGLAFASRLEAVFGIPSDGSERAWRLNSMLRAAIRRLTNAWRPTSLAVDG
jgi:hypothetical protein